MKKTILAAVVLFVCFAASAQKNPNWKKDIVDRPGDHFLVQLTADRWLNAPDSISSRIKTLSRGLGVSLMFDKPFKTDPHWSVAFGLSVNGSSIFFDRLALDISATGNKLPVRFTDTTERFKKYKLLTAFLEVPVELRYIFSPEKENKSWKAALGLKIGTLINAHTKGKTLVNRDGNTLNNFTQKESKKAFFNSNRIVATARVGVGHFSLVCNYQLSSLFKDGSAFDVKPLQIGLCISGL